jgi:hypothetical protein
MIKKITNLIIPTYQLIAPLPLKNRNRLAVAAADYRRLPHDLVATLRVTDRNQSSTSNPKYARMAKAIVIGESRPTTTGLVLEVFGK